MNIWEPREKSLQLISGELKPDADGIESSISAIEEVIVTVQDTCNSIRGRMTAVLLAKAHRLGIGAYSIALDCIGQEGGALIRPLQEIYEFLEFIRRDQTRAEASLDGKKPSAGVIAKAIDGRLQGLRDYFNTHASHLSLSEEALGHLINYETGSILIGRNPYDGKVLRHNLSTLAAVQNLIITEALLILDQENPGVGNTLFEQHDLRCKSAKERAVKHGIVQEGD